MMGCFVAPLRVALLVLLVPASRGIVPDPAHSAPSPESCLVTAGLEDAVGLVQLKGEVERKEVKDFPYGWNCDNPRSFQALVCESWVCSGCSSPKCMEACKVTTEKHPACHCPDTEETLGLLQLDYNFSSRVKAETLQATSGGTTAQFARLHRRRAPPTPAPAEQLVAAATEAVNRELEEYPYGRTCDNPRAFQTLVCESWVCTGCSNPQCASACQAERDRHKGCSCLTAKND